MAQSGKGRGARRGGLPGTALGLAALGVVAALVGAFVIGPMLQSKGDLKNGSHQLAAKPSSTTGPGDTSLTTEPGKSGTTLDADDGQPGATTTPAGRPQRVVSGCCQPVAKSWTRTAWLPIRPESSRIHPARGSS